MMMMMMEMPPKLEIGNERMRMRLLEMEEEGVDDDDDGVIERQKKMIQEVKLIDRLEYVKEELQLLQMDIVLLEIEF